MNYKTKSSINKIISFILIVGILIGAVALINHFVSNRVDDDGLVEVSPKFEVGGLSTYGKYVETKNSIYTKDAFECKGLNVLMEFDSTVSYEVFFYDKYGEFLISTGTKKVDFKDELLESVTHARVVITPIWDEDLNEDDKEIKWYQISKYTKQLTFKVFEKQKTKTYDETLNKTATAVIAKYGWKGTYDYENNEPYETTVSPWYWYGEVDASNYDELIIKLKSDDINKKVTYLDNTMDSLLLYDITNHVYEPVARFECEVLEIEGNYSYYSIDIENVGEFYFSTSYLQDSGLEMWLR